MEYEAPEWSSIPIYDYSLEVIKEGCIIDEIPLQGREFFILGRQHDVVQIPMDHQSISRRHAVLNFSKDGHLMLIDLNSAQGTVINKKPCAKGTYIKLNVGDVIKFGASTRLYVVKGPEELLPNEYVSVNLEQLRQKSEDKIEKWKKLKQMSEEVTWGMDDDAEEEEEQELEGSTTNEQDQNDLAHISDRFSGKDRMANGNLPEYLRKDENFDRKYGESFSATIEETEAKSVKDKEILEKIRKKEKKIQNMQEENRRIFMKEYSQDGGLTEGQLAAVNRNDQQITNLTQEIEALTNQIRSKYSTEGDKSGGTATSKKRSYEENDSELLDMSAQTADSTTNWRLRKKMNTNAAIASSIHKFDDKEGKEKNSSALSYDEIQTALTSALGKERTLSDTISQYQKKEKELQQSLSNSSVMDDLDVIIKNDELKEIHNKLKIFLAEQSTLQGRLTYLEKLSNIAKPDLSSLSKQSQGPESSSSAKESLDKEEVQNGIDKTNKTVKEIGVVRNKVHIDEDDSGKKEKDRLEGLKRFIEEEKQKEMQRLDSKGAEDNSSKKKSVALRKGESRQDTEGIVAENRNIAVKGPNKPSFALVAKAHVSKNILEGGDYVWVPPKAQKGDGRTSLNDKLGY